MINNLYQHSVGPLEFQDPKSFYAALSKLGLYLERDYGRVSHATSGSVSVDGVYFNGHDTITVSVDAAKQSLTLEAIANSRESSKTAVVKAERALKKKLQEVL